MSQPLPLPQSLPQSLPQPLPLQLPQALLAVTAFASASAAASASATGTFAYETYLDVAAFEFIRKAAVNHNDGGDWPRNLPTQYIPHLI